MTCEYLEYSLQYYRQIRPFLAESLGPLAQAGCRDIVLYGTGEVAEIAYLTMQEMDLNLVGVIDSESTRHKFFGYRVPRASQLVLPTHREDTPCCFFHKYWDATPWAGT